MTKDHNPRRSDSEWTELITECRRSGLSDTPDGATASAVLYTIVEMAKAHNLNVYRYLCYLLTRRPDKRWSDTRLSKLAPWDQDVMEVCQNDCQKD